MVLMQNTLRLKILRVPFVRYPAFKIRSMSEKSTIDWIPYCNSLVYVLCYNSFLPAN